VVAMEVVEEVSVEVDMEDIDEILKFLFKIIT
jgi:hypothetical protein